MSLQKENVYLDDWKDLKAYTEELEREEAEKKDQYDVTKDFVGDQIDDYKEYDEAKEQAEYEKIYQKIADISAGGGVDLSPYLKKVDAEETYAKKEDIEWIITNEQFNDTVEEKVNAGIQGLVNGASEDLDTFKEVGDSLTALNTEVAKKANSADVESTYAKKSDIPSVDEFATKAEVNAALDNKADKAEIPSTDDFATKEELTTAVADKATIAQVAAVDQKVDAIDLTPYATKEEVAVEDTSVLQNILGRIWTKKTANPSDGYFYTKLNTAKGYSLLFNESDGGGSQFKDDKTISYVGVNDGGTDTSTGIFAQIYSKDIATNEGARLNINPSGMFYGVGASTQIDAAHELAVKGDVNEAVSGKANSADVSAALEGKADAAEVNAALEKKANTVDVSVALDTKADESELVVAKSEYDELKARFDYLEQLVMEYLPDAQQEKVNDGKIDDLSPDNRAVNITEPMQSVQLPEATVAYTVDVPLKENATVELTSNKYVYINNTSKEPVDVTFGREVPATEADTVANPVVYITGQYDTLTISNVKISQKDYDTNSINNVIITEDNEKTVEITASLADGATVTNNSACPVDINNKAVTPRDGEPNSVNIVAPNSTVTIRGGQYNVLESTVGDDTLYINKAVHIKKLKVTKGNVIVNDYTVDGHIDEIENDTEYTVTPRTIEVYTQSDWKKASSTAALYEVMDDITTTSRIAPGIFGSNARIKLNGHKVTCSDKDGAFFLRGTSHYIIENGTIDCTVGYGVWLSGAGIVELKDVAIDADTHALYIEKSNGQIITSGNCYFRVKGDDKRYVANYLDSTYTGGWTTGFHFGAGTKFEDFDPMNSMSEPDGPVNLLDPGFHTVKTTELIDGVEHDIYTVVVDE